MKVSKHKSEGGLPARVAVSRFVPFKRSKRFCAAVAFPAIVAALFLYLQRSLVHPEFGRISEATMVEHPSVLQQGQFSVRKMLGLPTADRTWLLRIASAPLQWSSGGGARKGFIYMNHPLLNDTPFWEFALSAHMRLAEVRRVDLPSDYYGMNDARGATAFGVNWRGHALQVPEGQVFFARLVTNRSVVYVVRLAEQGSGRTKGQMRVEYVAVSNQPVNPIAGANGYEPRQLTKRMDWTTCRSGGGDICVPLWGNHEVRKANL